MSNIYDRGVVILDFGSQYTQLIARRVRESNVYSEIFPWDINEKKILDLNPKGVILSGGPNSVTDSFTPRIPQCIFELNVPILGICYGMQTLAEQMGGQVVSSDKKEFGHTNLEIENESILFKGIDKKINVWMSHGDQVQDLPDEFELIASTNFFDEPSSIGTSSESISINKLSTPLPYKAAIKCSIVETETPYSFAIFVQYEALETLKTLG